MACCIARCMALHGSAPFTALRHRALDPDLPPATARLPEVVLLGIPILSAALKLPFLKLILDTLHRSRGLICAQIRLAGRVSELWPSHSQPTQETRGHEISSHQHMMHNATTQSRHKAASSRSAPRSECRVISTDASGVPTAPMLGSNGFWILSFEAEFPGRSAEAEQQQSPQANSRGDVDPPQVSVRPHGSARQPKRESTTCLPGLHTNLKPLEAGAIPLHQRTREGRLTDFEARDERELPQRALQMAEADLEDQHGPTITQAAARTHSCRTIFCVRTPCKTERFRVMVAH